MKTKVLVLDIDGTLTNSKKEITPETKRGIIHIMERGHKVILASGRPTPGIQTVLHALNQGLVDLALTHDVNGIHGICLAAQNSALFASQHSFSPLF